MNITEEHKQKARELKILISRQDPEVLYWLSNFMDIDQDSDGGMFSQCAYEATARQINAMKGF